MQWVTMPHLQIIYGVSCITGSLHVLVTTRRHYQHCFWSVLVACNYKTGVFGVFKCFISITTVLLMHRLIQRCCADPGVYRSRAINSTLFHSALLSSILHPVCPAQLLSVLSLSVTGPQRLLLKVVRTAAQRSTSQHSRFTAGSDKKKLVTRVTSCRRYVSGFLWKYVWYKM